MALLTKTGMSKILRKIMEMEDLPEEIEEGVLRLQSDFDERTGYLASYGDIADGEDIDEYEFTVREEKNVEGSEEGWEEKYRAMKQKYIDRFFGTTEVKEEVEEVEEETEEDVKRDGKEQTFDKLLEKVEG